MADPKRPKPGTKKRIKKNESLPDIFQQAQPEVLLSEAEYGEGIADLFDILFPDRVVKAVYKPFFNMLIRKHQVRSACDLACRTGQTLKMLRELKIEKLTGIDISPKMTAKCRKKISSKIQFIGSDLALAPSTITGKQFDMILCTKDALPVVLDDDALINFFRDLRLCLTDNGLLVIEINNYQKIWRNKERFLPVIDRSVSKQPQLFFFMNDFHEELLVRNLMHLRYDHQQWKLRPLSIPIRPLLPAEIEFFLTEGQYSKWAFLGNYQGQSYIPEQSPHLIVIAKK